MDTIQDFEDILYLLNKFKVKYLIIGGLSFIFYAKPRYTKDIDIWIDPTLKNIENANKALYEFGSPNLISIPININEILQIGVEPNRIDIFLNIPKLKFNEIWKKRKKSAYGKIIANWINLDSLIKIKKNIKEPKHQLDYKILLKVKKLKNENKS